MSSKTGMNIISSVVLILVGTKLRVEAAIAAGDNKAEFSGICGLVRLYRSTITIPTLTNLTAAGYAKLQAYNMSVSDDAWQKIFLTGKADPKYHETVPEGAPTPNDWQTKWKDWLQAKKEIDAQPESTTLKNTPFAKLTAQQKTHIRPLINALTEKANKLRMQFKEDARTTQAPETGALTAKLKEALIGTATKDETTALLTDIWGGNGNGGRATLCVTGTEANRVNTLYAALACLCADNSGSAVPAVCHHKVTNTEQWRATPAAPTAENTRTIVDLCGPGQQVTLTAAKLHQVLATVKQHITSVGNDGYIGSYSSACDGQAANGVCVNITDYKTQGEAALRSLRWYGPLKDIEDKLQNREVAAMQGAIKKQLIEAAVAEAEQISVEAQKMSFKASATPTAAENTDHTESQQAKCSAHDGNKATCPATQCSYDNSTNKCKPKTETVTTAAGTGEGNAGTTTTKCSDDDTKEKCEAVNKDGKKQCIWRRGGGRNYDKNTEKCLNGSFPVKKKLALISAAFDFLVEF
uniref:Variant surface glycoprotein 367 n=1 Tax=Trypanosoma brucei TaxID=5691 RepID=M4SWX0_9TRYP|nr:variant surface glycoprotein 367 [Trypanosoma brucei]